MPVSQGHHRRRRGSGLPRWRKPQAAKRRLNAPNSGRALRQRRAAAERAEQERAKAAAERAEQEARAKAAAQVAADRRVALVIGNSAYSHFPAIPNPRNDAEDIGRMLKGLGFEVLLGIDLNRADM